MKREDWTVGDSGIRPAGKPDRCFYCGELKGSQHKSDCVIRSRTVVIRVSIEYVVDVPESYDSGSIEYLWNEHNRGADQTLNEIRVLRERVGGEEFCSLVWAEYLREATVEDELESRLFTDQLPS